METWLNEALDAFDANNDSLAAETGSLLTRIVPAAGVHARFINTLSLLEHLGSHRIMVTQHSATVEEATLRHVAEEAHHAYYMKHQAEKVAAEPLDYSAEALLAPAAARMYFKRLEVAMQRVLSGRHHGAAYLYMSLVIEFRALWFYQLYQQVLKAAGHPLSLKRLLGEEQHHLREMARRLETTGYFNMAWIRSFLVTEHILYTRLIYAMQRALRAAV